MSGKSKKPLGISIWWFSIPSFVLLVFIVVAPICLSQPGLKFMNLATEGSAWIGDSIGGITAPFVGVLAVIATFLAFWAQYKYNQKQLEFTIKEQFNHAFYEMLGIHESITNSLRLESTEIRRTFERERDIPIDTVEVKTGREVFAYMYENLVVYEDETNGMFSCPNSKQYIGLKGLFCAKQGKAYPIYESNKSVISLDHYFRQLYSIFKMIKDNKDIDEQSKYEYSRIVRSTLSQYELILLFYNCLSSNGSEKFKPLVEDYSILKNLRKDLLADQNECNKYKEKAFDSDCKL